MNMDTTTPVQNPPWNRLHTVYERYNGDSMFRQLVDTLEAFVERGEFTPSEVRQAAILASMRVADRQIQAGPIIIERGALAHLGALESLLDKA